MSFLKIIDPATDPTMRDAYAKEEARLKSMLAVKSAPPPEEPQPRSAFPTEALPEPLQSMVRHAALQTTAPESLCAAAGLGFASASIGSALQVQSGVAQTMRANLFLTVFAESGTSKGQASKTMGAPYFEEGRRLTEEWQREERPRLLAELERAKAELEQGNKMFRKDDGGGGGVVDAQEMIRQAIRRKCEAEDALAREPLLNIGNATAEGIMEALVYAPGEAAAIISAEARDIVDNLLGRYSSGGKGSDEAIFLQGYSGDPVTHKRKGKSPLILHSPCLTLCLAVQPDIWERMAGDPRLMESGFLARALAFNSHAPPCRSSQHSIPEAVSAPWGSAVRTLLAGRETGATGETVIPSEGARQILDALKDEASDRREEGGDWSWCKPFAARLAENATRLALVFHAVAQPSNAASLPLTEETARNAITVARWFFAETLALLSPLRSQKNTKRMDRLTEIFRDKKAVSLPAWVLRDNHGYQEDELKSLALEYPSRLTLEKGKAGERGGRPSLTVHLK